MNEVKRTNINTLISAMRILARDIESQDGVANAAIAEAAERLDEIVWAAKRCIEGSDSTLQSRLNGLRRAIQ